MKNVIAVALPSPRYHKGLDHVEGRSLTPRTFLLLHPTPKAYLYGTATQAQPSPNHPHHFTGKFLSHLSKPHPPFLHDDKAGAIRVSPCQISSRVYQVAGTLLSQPAMISQSSQQGLIRKPIPLAHFLLASSRVAKRKLTIGQAFFSDGEYLGILPAARYLYRAS
jgi:hypothetical protein